MYSIILTYLVTDFEKGTLIYTVYIFIRIEKKYLNKVRKVRCTFEKKRHITINGTYIVFKFNFPFLISTDSLSNGFITLLSLTLTSFLNVGIWVLGQKRTCFIVSKFGYQQCIE